MGKDDTQVIIEYFDEKIANMLEGVESSLDKKVRLIVREELESVKTDIQVIKTAVTVTNQDIIKLQNDVAELQAA